MSASTTSHARRRSDNGSRGRLVTVAIEMNAPVKRNGGRIKPEDGYDGYGADGERGYDVDNVNDNDSVFGDGLGRGTITAAQPTLSNPPLAGR